MGAKYTHDYAAFRVEVLQAPFMEAEMRRRAEKVAEQFRATAPVGNPIPEDEGGEGDEHPTQYRDSAEVTSGPDGGLAPPGARAYGRVTVTDEHAMSIEFGHRYRRKDGKIARIEGAHTLTKAMGAAGDD